MKNERGSIIMVAIPLLAILFISIGIYTYNSAVSTIDRASVDMSQYENMMGDHEIVDYDLEDDNLDDYDYDDDYSSYFNMAE